MCFASEAAQARESLFSAKGSLAQAKGARPSESSRNLQCFLITVSPKRELVT